MKTCAKKLLIGITSTLLISYLLSPALATVTNIKTYSTSFTTGSIVNAPFSNGKAKANLKDYNCGYYTTLRVAAGYQATVTITMACQKLQSNGLYLTQSVSTLTQTIDNRSGVTTKVVPSNSNKVAVVCNSADMDVVNGETYRYRITVTAPGSCSGRYWGIMSSTNGIHGSQVDKP